MTFAANDAKLYRDGAELTTAGITTGVYRAYRCECPQLAMLDR